LHESHVPRKTRRHTIAFALLFLLAVAVLWISLRINGADSDDGMTPTSELGEPLELFAQRPIGNKFTEHPRISFVKIVDLDRDALSDILVCDCVENTVSWIRQTARGEFTERLIADQMIAPARVECIDFDTDGDLDIFVAVLGKLFPTNEHIGSLIALENTGDEIFQRHVLLDQVARVSDVRCGDLDGDEDLDLVVTQFGYDDGMTQWLENRGAWQFAGHILQRKAGGIHGIIADMNGDQLPDIVSLVSQQFEQIFQFSGQGKGHFSERELFHSKNTEYGSAGIWLTDLDRDDDLDVLYCNGDALDYSPPQPWPWHGVQWLENTKSGFVFHRLLDFGGAVIAQAVDYDADGDIDIFVASAFNDWFDPNGSSLIALENVGKMQFVAHPLANSPTHIQAMDVGDVDGDGFLDLVTGGMHVAEPYDRVARVLLWRGLGNQFSQPKPTPK
jgi:FG-GAP-like repeat